MSEPPRELLRCMPSTLNSSSTSAQCLKSKSNKTCVFLLIPFVEGAVSIIVFKRSHRPMKANCSYIVFVQTRSSFPQRPVFILENDRCLRFIVRDPRLHHV